MSYFLNRELAIQAINIMKPSIERLDSKLAGGGRFTIHIVILDPSNGNTLYEETLGEKDKRIWRLSI